MCQSMLFFFFSSRRRHTRLQGDWSSDVCSSDLRTGSPEWWETSEPLEFCEGSTWTPNWQNRWTPGSRRLVVVGSVLLQVAGKRMRSEERRVGKECRSRWSPYH